ncbi:MAG: DNA replication protein DnaC [Syntrophorhabdus sp. PtaU1.Bin002]|nr:MAG: DNA replication protein DnaC [Syntrophorhabdus sp. PtaU1.Bin002]
MKPATEALLADHLKQLKLTTILRCYNAPARQARESGTEYEDFLLSLIESEMEARADNRLKRRIRDARFPLMKTMEGFDFDATSLDRRLIRELAEGGYIGERRNIIFVGKTGTGKTHLATALGLEACRQGIRTRFVTGAGLTNELIEARSERVVNRLIQKTSRFGLLILDELGYVPFSREGSQLLFQLLAERYERASVIITTNLGFADWTQLFGDPTLTAALLDRLTHKAHIVMCDWDSYRLRESLKRRSPGNRETK